MGQNVIVVNYGRIMVSNVLFGFGFDNVMDYGGCFWEEDVDYINNVKILLIMNVNIVGVDVVLDYWLGRLY